MSRRSVDPPRRLVDGGEGTSTHAELGRLLASLGEPSPPPYSRARVWAGVRERLAANHPPRRRRRLLIAAGGATAALVSIALWSGAVYRERHTAPAAPASSPCVLVDVGAGASLVQGQAAAPRARPGSLLPVGSRLTTAGDAAAHVRCAGRLTMLVAPHSELALLAAAEPGDRVQVTHGEVAFRVAPRAPGDPFVVLAQDRIVRVVGTVFAVRVGGEVEVEVHEGAVEVTGPGDSATLEAGERWSSGRDGVGCPEAAGSGAARVRGDSAPPGSTPEAAPASRAQRSLLTEPSPPPERPVPAGSELERLQGRLHAELAPLEREAVLYDMALLLQGHERWEEAAAALEQVAEMGRARAELALYELGRLRHRSLHDPEGARRALESYRSRFPRGDLRQEVDLSLIEVLLSGAEATAALVEIERFLAAYPESERRFELRLARGDLLRARGDCEGAAADYDVVARSAPPGRLADDALYFAASCATRLGRSAAARALLLEYLRRFPDGRHASEVRAAASPEARE